MMEYRLEMVFRYEYDKYYVITEREEKINVINTNIISSIAVSLESDCVDDFIFLLVKLNYLKFELYDIENDFKGGLLKVIDEMLEDERITESEKERLYIMLDVESEVIR